MSNQSKLAIITDTHIGCNGGSSIFRDLFREYYQDVLIPDLIERGITKLVHLGDFFDNRSRLTLHDIAYVMTEFIPLLRDNDIELIIVAGNHDVAYKNTNRIHSLELFSHLDNVTVVPDNLYKVSNENKYNFYICPWLNDENSERILTEISKIKQKNKSILGGHFEIEGVKMYSNSIANVGGLNQNVFKGFHNVLSGHFHHPSKYGNIQYVGALFHYNWNDWNDWRGYQILDLETGELESVENEYCLFDQYAYEDVLQIPDSEYKDNFEGKILRIQIYEEYNKIELKDIISKIENCMPVSVSVVDNTFSESLVLNTDESESVEKEVTEYFVDAIDNSEYKNKQELKSLFDTLYTEAKEQMVEFE